MDNALLDKLWSEYQDVKCINAYDYALSVLPNTATSRHERALYFTCFVAGYIAGKESVSDD